MPQTPIPFSSSFRSLTLNVTTGTSPNQVTYTQAITSASMGNNTFQITNANLINTFNSQPLGTIFNPSIVATYGSDSNGDALTSVSTPSVVANFIPRVISLANIPNKLTTDTSFSLSSLISTVSTGNLSYLSSNQAVASVDSSGLVTPVGAVGTTTITVNQAATANHPAGTASATLTVILPQLIIRASNNITIQYKGAAHDVPNNMPRFIEADPRNTGNNEWFAVVKNGMKNDIKAYANGINTPFIPSGQSVPVPFDNIVTTLMTDMSYMFVNALSFNQPIGSWDTSNVTNMDNIFNSAVSFNQPIGSWNTENVIIMRGMFIAAYAFNQPIGSWNTTKVTNMHTMFYLASVFNQPIGSWNTFNVTNMDFMFTYASIFNQPINLWDTTNVTSMTFMFRWAFNFNQPLYNWNVSNVINMDNMFDYAVAFNQNLSGWNVALTSTRPSLSRNYFAINSPLALPENSHKLPPFV